MHREDIFSQYAKFEVNIYTCLLVAMSFHVPDVSLVRQKDAIGNSKMTLVPANKMDNFYKNPFY